MEILEQNNIEQMTGVERQKAFRVTDKSMHMLFTALINMYSNPIESIVREITSNALDAHTERENKKSGKWELEPGEDINYLSDNKNIQIEFIDQNKILGIGQAIIFRDFGVGLSSQRVEDTYTVFGESTKRNSNDEIGGLNSEPSLNRMNCWKPKLRNQQGNQHPSLQSRKVQRLLENSDILNYQN